jgi:hypothetical protein
MLFPLRFLIVFGAALVSWPVAGQNTATESSTSLIANLQLLSRNAGYVFDGTVLSVSPVALNDGNSVPAFQITFRVEQAIRGTHAGQILRIREWAGLWNAGARYRTGERLLLFFYAPGKLGLTSSVAGSLGRFPVDSSGNLIQNNLVQNDLVQQNRLLPPSTFDSIASTGLRKEQRLSTRAVALAIRRADGR